MRGRTTGEVVALHGAGKALADGGAGDIDQLAGLEDLGREFGAGLRVGGFASDEPELDQRATWLDLGLGVVAVEGLAIQLRATLAVGDLHGAIAVHRLALHLGDAIGEHFDDRDGHGFAGFCEDSRHAAFAADQSDSHLAVLGSAARTRGIWNERETGRPPWMEGLQGSRGLGLSCSSCEDWQVANRSRFHVRKRGPPEQPTAKRARSIGAGFAMYNPFSPFSEWKPKCCCHAARIGEIGGPLSRHALSPAEPP